MAMLAMNITPSVRRLTHFDRIGGELGVVSLVDAFYSHMDALPVARGIRAMHEHNLDQTKAVLVLYLCEWLGGPRQYSALRGHPRLRMRHTGFAIGNAERDARLACMGAALDDSDRAAALKKELLQGFREIADKMRNHLSTTTKELI